MPGVIPVFPCLCRLDSVGGGGDDEDDLAGNPVGELQEMTQKKLWPPPVYEFTSEQGPPHAREFVCTVRLFNLAEQGEKGLFCIIFGSLLENSYRKCGNLETT